MERRFQALKTTLLAATILISLIIVSPVLVADDGTTEDKTRLWGRVIDSETDMPLKGATISVRNLQTGEIITLTQDEAQYRLDDTPGYFNLSASYDGYFDTGEGHNEVMVLKGDIKKIVLNLEKIVKERKITGDVFYINESGNQTPIENSTVSLYCTKGSFIGYEDSKLTPNGSYEFEVFPGDFLLRVEKEDFVTQVATVEVNATHDKAVDFNMTEGDITFKIYGYAEDDTTGEPVDGITVTLYDVNTSRKLATSSNDSYFYLEAYPSTFDLILDADGYHPYVKEGIILNEVNEDNFYWYRIVELKKDIEESLTIDLTVMGDNFSVIKVERDWHLNSDSEIPGIETGPGNLRMKINSDKRFSDDDDDNELSDAEVLKFKEWFESIGPEFLYTDNFFKVNDTVYDPDMNGAVFNYTVILEHFNLSVDNITDMRMKTTMIYVTDNEDVIDPDNFAYKIWLGDLGEDYNVNFGASFEIITGETDDWHLALDGNEKAIPHKAVIKNATTLELFKKEAPKANVTATLNGVNYYSLDEIIAGSATDNTISKDDYENMTFDASGSSDKVGKIVNYTWDFGDGEKGYGEVVEHNYSVASGTTQVFVVTLTVLDSAGVVNGLEDNTAKITVDSKPPTLPANLTQLIETPLLKRNQSEKIVFNASTATDDTEIPDSAGNYIWEFETGTEKFGETIEQIFYEAGETIVNLTVKDKVGNKITTSLTLNILDTEPPIVEIQGGPSAEVDQWISLNASACNDNVDDIENLTFSWNFSSSYADTNANKTDDGINVSVKYNEPTTYVISLNVSDRSGNYAVAIHTITITAPDLEITKLEVSDLKPREDEKINIRATIRNIGGADAKPFTVYLLVDEREVETSEEGLLAFGSEVSVNFTWKAEAGEHDIVVYADWGGDYNDSGEITETNENNNYKEALVKVTKPTSYVALIVVIVLIVIAIVIFIVLKKKRGV